jgi:hypothetical protein
MENNQPMNNSAYDQKMQAYHEYCRRTYGNSASAGQPQQSLSVNNMNSSDLANAVASGKHRYDADQAIGALIILGFIFFPLAPVTAFIGVPFLTLAIWSRNKF